MAVSAFYAVLRNVEEIRRKFELLAPVMDERMTRLWAAAEAMVLGRGGPPVVTEASGILSKHVSAGKRDVVRDLRRREGERGSTDPARGSLHQHLSRGDDAVRRDARAPLRRPLVDVDRDVAPRRPQRPARRASGIARHRGPARPRADRETRNRAPAGSGRREPGRRRILAQPGRARQAHLLHTRFVEGATGV